MAYTFTNITNDIISLHPFGLVLKPNESLSLELEDINAHIAKLVEKGQLSVSPALADGFLPYTENQTINAIDDVTLRFIQNLALHTEITATNLSDPKQKQLTVRVGFRGVTYDTDGVTTTNKFMSVVVPTIASCTMVVVDKGGNATDPVFDPVSPKFQVVSVTANRNKFSTTADVFSFNPDQSLLAGIIPPQTYDFFATSIITVPTTFTGVQIKATVPGIGFKRYDF